MVRLALFCLEYTAMVRLIAHAAELAGYRSLTNFGCQSKTLMA
jgi:hypothetical protein